MREGMKVFWSVDDEHVDYEYRLFRGGRLVIPKTWRQRVLKQINCGHMGIQSCLTFAMETVCWLGMSQYIKD